MVPSFDFITRTPSVPLPNLSRLWYRSHPSEIWIVEYTFAGALGLRSPGEPHYHELERSRGMAWLEAVHGELPALCALGATLQPDSVPAPTLDRQWLKVSEAASIAGTSTGIISRAVGTGKLRSNGKTGHARRIDPADFSHWQLQRARRPELNESDEAVRRKIERHFQR